MANLDIPSAPVRRSSTRDVALLSYIARELRNRIQGEVRFDDASRALYSTDASPYEIRPYGVVLPKTPEDISVVLEVARRHQLAVLPRGGGTSLAGQTVGEAIVVDVSKYMTKILRFDPEAAWVQVQPGVVRDNLNRFLAPHKLQFTPDISTTAQANIGGMVANNSAGTRSVKYGKSVDQVLSMRVMLADGSIAELKAVDDSALQKKLAQPGIEGDAYRTVHRVISEHREEIEARFPKVMRRVGGYNLDEFIHSQPFNLAKLVSGSEGTLAFILDITLKLYPVPSHRCFALLHFDTLVKSLEAVRYINRHRPSAVEIFDDHLFNLGKKNPQLAPLLGWLKGEPAAVLMVEFDGESEAEMLQALHSLQADENINRLSYHNHVASNRVEQEDFLEFRRGGLGIYATVKGKYKPVPFIEDAAIPIENLPYYIPEVLEVCRKHGVKAVLYAHASVGVIHIRPHIDLKAESGIALFRKISEETFTLVKKYGGSWSGEHGDGLIRSYQNKALFGNLLYEDFRCIKASFDPYGIFNPGKIVDAPPMTENLRYGSDYHPKAPAQTYFDFGAAGGFLDAIEACTGVGKCRKTDSGTMCPSYMATRDEDHSTRGRANILRAAMSGRLSGGLTSREVYDALDLCLECKACKAECPSQVDMAKIKYEFLQHYYDVHGTPWAVRAVGNIARLAPVGRLFAPLANALLRRRPARWLMEKVLKVDRRRVMPLYARQSFAQWFNQRPNRRPSHTLAAKAAPANSAPMPPEKPRVALFCDTWTMYNDPHIGIAATKVLEALGYEVELINYGCCGRPQISKGLLKEAKPAARRNVDRLYGYVERGVPVVGLEPSCVAAFQDDYRELVPGEKSEVLARHVTMIDQFLVEAWRLGQIDPYTVFHKKNTPLLLHGHCQQRAIMGTSASKAVLGWLSEQVQEVDSGCCGMAGAFGYSHYDVSMQIGEQRLFPAVRQHRGETVASGFSCRHQIQDGAAKRAKHLVEIMAEALESTPSQY